MMHCAVVEHKNGKKSHHTNVKGFAFARKPAAGLRLILRDNSEVTIKDGVAVKMVDDLWLLTASGLIPQA